MHQRLKTGRLITGVIISALGLHKEKLHTNIRSVVLNTEIY